MTSKIEVSRDLLWRVIEGAGVYDDSPYYMDGISELRALLAAPEAPRQSPIGWFTDDYLTDKSSTTYDELTSNRWKDKGWPVQPLYSAPLSPDHSGGAGVVVLPSDKEIREIKTKAARQADLTSGANYYTAAEFAADALLDKVKELNQ